MLLVVIIRDVKRLQSPCCNSRACFDNDLKELFVPYVADPSHYTKRFSSEVLLAHIFAKTLLSDLFSWASEEKCAWRTTKKYNL